MGELGELIPVERVRCLDCGGTYLKPCGGSTEPKQHGCPTCGYAGWIAADVSFTPDERHHFGAGRLRPPNDRRR